MGILPMTQNIDDGREQQVVSSAKHRRIATDPFAVVGTDTFEAIDTMHVTAIW